MNRTIIRALGSCLAAFAALWTRVGYSDHAIFTVKPIEKTTVNNVYAYRTTGSVGMFPTAACNSFVKSGCGDVTNASGGCSGSSIIECVDGNRDNVLCLWCLCASESMRNNFAEQFIGGYDPCGVNSSCNTTGLLCTDGNPVYMEGGKDENGSARFEYNSGPHTITVAETWVYMFSNCQSGWFQTSNCYTGATQSINEVQNCCKPCSGLRDYYPMAYSGGTLVTGGVTTFRNTGDTNSYTSGGKKYIWFAQSGFSGIESCRGYLPEASYEVSGIGTYKVHYCEYQE